METDRRSLKVATGRPNADIMGINRLALEGLIYEPREAEKDFLYHRSVVLGFFIVCVAMLLAMNHVPAIRYGLIKSNPILVSGVIKFVEAGDDDIKNIIYFFEDHAGVSHNGIVQLSYNYDESAHAIGREIAVEYFKYNPAIFFAKEQLDRERGVFFAFIVCLVAMALLIWGLWRTFHSIRHFKAVSRKY